LNYSKHEGAAENGLIIGNYFGWDKSTLGKIDIFPEYIAHSCVIHAIRGAAQYVHAVLGVITSALTGLASELTVDSLPVNSRTFVIPYDDFCNHVIAI